MNIVFGSVVVLLLSSCSFAQIISGNDITVVLYGHQVQKDTREAVSGFFAGIRKSGNMYLKGELSNVKFLFLELGPGGLFEADNGTVFVKPWLQSHLELLSPKIVMSLGHAAAIVDEVAGNLPGAGRLKWHLKCFQDECSATGPAERETCYRFRPPAREVLRYIGELKPGVRRVVLPHDGSALARHIAEGLGVLSTAEREVLCGASCAIEEVPVATLAVLNATAQRAAAAEAFLLLPSVEGIADAAPADVARALGPLGLAGMVPPSVAGPGNGLIALRPHAGSAMEECSLVIAQAISLANVNRGVEVRESEMYKLSVNAQLVPANLSWRNGMLQHNGRESWNPLELVGLGPVAARVAPKVLCSHSYGRFYGFTFYEHTGFIKGLLAAGHNLDCLDGEQSCLGDLEVSVLYFLTKFFFTTDATKKAIYGYSHEYIKRYMPDVVYVTDDNGLKYGVLPCFEPLTRGPNPTYHECHRTQYIAVGINADVRRSYRDRCMEYTSAGLCAGGNFFIEPGAANSQACGACILGTEAACSNCNDLYSRVRPVNITIHLEAPSTESTAEYMKSVKPSVQKMLIIVDDSETSRSFKDIIMQQYAQMVAKMTTWNVSIDFDNDWHAVGTPAEFKQVYESYQARPEYMIWLPTIVSMLPGDAAARRAIWRDFIRTNKLGEVVIPGETSEALLSSGSHPDSMGRVAAQYADMIIRGLATAADLMFVTAPLAKTFVNVDRPKQLREHSILPIPPKILAAASQIFTMCPPGMYHKEGRCEACMAGRFKGDYGDSADACELCYSLNGMQMYSPPGSTNSSSCMCDRTYYQQDREVDVCDNSSQLANTDYCCRQCLEGTFQSDRGRHTCNSCGGGKNTRFLGALDAGACQCPPGKRLLPDGTCIVCGLGQACKDWDVLATEAEPGFMISPGPIEGASGTEFIFTCYGDTPGPKGGRRCPGGPPGTCAAGRTGYQCAECEQGKMPMPDSTCAACSDEGQARLPIAIAVCICGIIALYINSGRHVTKNSMDMLAIVTCMSFLVAAVQMLGVLNMLELSWGEPIGSFLKEMKLFLLDLEVLSITCNLDMGPQDHFLLKCIMLPIGIGILIFFHVAYCGIFHGFQMWEQRQRIISSLGMLNIVVFISYVSAVVAVFLCERHPSGLLTNRKYLTVLCWQPGAHSGMVAMSLAFLLLPLAFLSSVLWSVWQLPRRMCKGDGDFVMMWAWLFYRFRTQAHYYALLLLLRGFSFSLVPILPSSTGQIIVAQLATLCFLLIICYVRPWKSAAANTLDAFLNLCLNATCGVAPFFSEEPDVRVAGIIACTLCAIFLIIVPLVVAFKTMRLLLKKRQKPYSFFLCHHRTSAGAFTKLLRLQLEETTKKHVFLNTTEERELETYMHLIRNESNCFVLIGSRGIAERPFLMGQLAVAGAHRVWSILVAFPGFEMPTDTFIEEYELHCPGVVELLASGVPMQCVRDALYWLRQLPQLSLQGKNFDARLMPALASDLTAGGVGRALSEAPCRASGSTKFPESAILADPSDWEATASGHILARALGTIVRGRELPAVLRPCVAGEVQEAPPRRLLVACTARAWFSPEFAELLVAACQGAEVAIPVIVEDDFTFPDELVYEELALQHAVGGKPGELRAAMEALLAVACHHFVPQSASSSEANLYRSAQEIAEHLGRAQPSNKKLDRGSGPAAGLWAESKLFCDAASCKTVYL